MRNTIKIALICIIVIASLLIPNMSNAMSSHGYFIDLIYSSIVAGTPTRAEARLIGNNADIFTNVRINFDVKGPATPSIIAYEEDGTPVDVMQYGYYGPEEGFTAGGEFVNSTPIEATFPVPGTYTITMELVDMSNSQAVIASETYTIGVGVRVTVVTGEDEGTYVTDGIASFDSLMIPEPVKDGYVFAGWYSDADFTTPFDTTKDLTENTTVYAKFELAENQTGNSNENNTNEEENIAGDDQTSNVVEEEKDETPKTGVANYLGIAALVAVISTIAVISLKRKNS